MCIKRKLISPKSYGEGVRQYVEVLGSIYGLHLHTTPDIRHITIGEVTMTEKHKTSFVRPMYMKRENEEFLKAIITILYIFVI